VWEEHGPVAEAEAATAGKGLGAASLLILTRFLVSGVF